MPGLNTFLRHANHEPWFSPAPLFALGFFLFLTGNFIDELAFGSSISTVDVQVHDTMFVIAHAHLWIFFALTALAFSAVYSLFPRLTGRALNAPMGYVHFGITLVAAFLLCWPIRHNTGLAGMPRRYFEYGNYIPLTNFGRVIPFKSKVTILLLSAQFLFIVNLMYSLVKGEKVTSV